ncbi:MAG: hypothetical protein A4E66_00974 [Syntrophus sp. PtaB.Bin001]|nr:MAG: hypothetical protein A4E66_00974 [Syntrophus sp. PtaB.Bin001]
MNAGECPRCGVIFDKIKSPEEKSKPFEHNKKIETGNPSPEAGFISRHKWTLTFTMLLVLAIIMIVPFIQSKYKQQFASRLATFDQNLKMETQAEFETSLDNMKQVIEVAAIMVGKRGWSESDTEWFYREAQKRVKTFLETMNKTAGGQNRLFDARIDEVKNDLGGGMHMLLLSIRDEDLRGKWLLVSAFSGKSANSSDFNPDLLIDEGNYSLCDVARYQGSSQMKLVRNGGKWSLRERTESEKIAFKNKQPWSFLPPQQAHTPAETEAEEVFKKVSNEISLMQFAYRRRHQTYCGNLQDLIDDHLSIERSEVSPELKDMIDKGKIALELTSTGYRVKDLRGK